MFEKSFQEKAIHPFYELTRLQVCMLEKAWHVTKSDMLRKKHYNKAHANRDEVAKR